MTITCNKDLSHLDVTYNTRVPVGEEVIFNVNGRKIVVPEDYKTDGYSVPPYTEWFVAGFPVEPAVLHDYSWKLAHEQKDVKARRKADLNLWQYLGQYGISLRKRTIILAAVFIYGEFKSWQASRL